VVTVVVGVVVTDVVSVVVGDVISQAENVPVWKWCVASFNDGTRSLQWASLANIYPPTPQVNIETIGVM